jgi:signal transduction histidine kinase
MFSKILRELSKKLNLRLSAVFTALFIVSFLVLFGIIYAMLSSSMRREDRETMGLKLLELWTHYRLGGIQKIQTELLMAGDLAGEDIIIIRILDQQKSTLFLWLHSDWRSSALTPLLITSLGLEDRVITIRLGGIRYVLETASIRIADGNTLQIGMDVTDRSYLLSRMRITFGFGIIPVVLLSFLTGSYLAARALRPIARLSSTARSIIDTGRIDARIPVKHTRPERRDELDELVILFNRMLERVEILVRGMRDALDNVAHDLRTPMTRLRGSAELALRTADNPESCREALAESLEESERIITMLNTLMDISEAETGAMKLNRNHVPVSTLVEECVEVYRYLAEEKGVSLERDVAGNLQVYADENRLRQALLNLIDNALKYTSKGGLVSITARLQKDEDATVVEVHDTGSGIDPGEIEQIWNRLYRGEKHRSTPGLGLGLSLVQAIAKAHGGTVTVTSTPRKGSTFSIAIPRDSKPDHE